MATDGGSRFKSIKSLPVDYRFTGSPGEKSASGGKFVGIPENGSGNMDRDVDDDSPYGQSSSFFMNYRPSVDDEDVNPSVSPQGSVLGSRGNKKWGDTASYVAKKAKLSHTFVGAREMDASFAEISIKGSNSGSVPAAADVKTIQISLPLI